MPLPLYLEHFTDRQDQIAAFDALWPGDGRWLLAFSGVSGNGKSTVLFLDTCERFAEASPPPTVARLWHLLGQSAARAPGLRVVVGGRQDLPFEPLRDWTCWHPLGEFNWQDCDRFLSSFGMNDAALRRKTYELFKGHPLTTRMMAEAFADARRRGQPVTLDVLQQSALARSHDEWLYGLVLKNLPDPLQRPAKYGPLLRRFTQATLNAALDLQLDDAAFHTLVTRAFVKPVGPGVYAFHETVRRVQIEYLSGASDPEAVRVRQRIVENAPARVEPERDALYHACFLDPASQFDEWRDTVDRAGFIFDNPWWNELLDVMQVCAMFNKIWIA